MKKIEDVKILVVGDIMLDKYVLGTVERISPEFPGLIVDVIDEYHTLGGSGNVVRNLCELGARVDCLASIGDDLEGSFIERQLNIVGSRSFLFCGSKRTTVKERIIADQRKVQLLRIDREDKTSINPVKAISMLESYGRSNYDTVIVSDYAKGMVSEKLMSFLKNNYKCIIVDPKPANGILYDGVFMITPNEKEWGQMVTSSAYNLKNVKFILETKGKKGMTLIDNKNAFTSFDIPSEEVPVYNVSGCGDVVVAVVSTCVSMGLNIYDSSKLANACAGYTATLPGTSVIPKEKFIELYQKLI